ncbi:MAG: threonine synthase [Desulfosarcinaceae bacterium]|nr:threonine synthase [Desulfosarcinaceae bacterium]
MSHVTDLTCLVCGKRYPPDGVAYVCPDHGNEGILSVNYDYDRIQRHISRERLARDGDPTMWRYRALLPMAPEAELPPLTVGGTPLYQTRALGASLGLRRLWVKDEGRQPTASLKDRASALAVVKAREKRAPVITTASTGNAAAALAGLCASVGQPNIIFVPASAPQAKIAQLLAFGAQVMLVEGSYDQAVELCLAAADTYGWYNRTTGFNPYMTEGKKTAAYEICEQLGWRAPQRVFVSVGDGCIIGALHKGFADLLALGWIEEIPRLMGVQAAGSNYLYTAWAQAADVLTQPPISADTVADSISAGLPRDRLKAMAAVRASEGAFIEVSDTEILAAIPELAAKAGIFAEPAAAAAHAGLVKAAARGEIGADEEIVLLSTGSGLKDVASAMQAVASRGISPQRVAPDLSAFKEMFATKARHDEETPIDRPNH